MRDQARGAVGARAAVLPEVVAQGRVGCVCDEGEHGQGPLMAAEAVPLGLYGCRQFPAGAFGDLLDVPVDQLGPVAVMVFDAAQLRFAEGAGGHGGELAHFAVPFKACDQTGQ